MSKLSSRAAAFAAAALALGAAIAVALTGLRAGPAEAQGLMSAPACQCSASTAVSGLSIQVAHCLCGGVACVLSQSTGAAGTAGAGHRMQCVK